MSKQSKDAIRYMKLCNLIETLWMNRQSKKYYDIQLDDLVLLTSPQARRIATFIDNLYR